MFTGRSTIESASPSLPRVGFSQRNENPIPYLFTSPATSGHGSLAAAVGAIIAELEPGTLYAHEGRDLSAAELAEALLLIVAAQEVSGTDAPPIRFSRSHSASTDAEYTIVKRDDATVYIVTEDSVIEMAMPDARPESRGASGSSDTTAKNLVSA